MNETPDKGTERTPVTKEEWFVLEETVYQMLIERGSSPADARMIAGAIVDIHVSDGLTIADAADAYMERRAYLNATYAVPPVPESGKSHGERITNMTPAIDRATPQDNQDIEISISSEISERAPTKDRPDPVYGTSSTVSLTYRLGDIVIGDYLTELIGDLHERQEVAMQEEIARRKRTKETATSDSGDAPDSWTVRFS